MGTGSVHSGSKGCESSESSQSSQTWGGLWCLWHTSPPNHSPILPLSSGIGVSQVTVYAAHRTERDVPPPRTSVRCTAGGTSSAVRTSTAARVPARPSLTWPAVHKAASPTRAQLSLTLPLPHSTADLCIIVPGSVGEVPAVAMHVHYTINAHDSSCIRNTDGNPVRNIFVFVLVLQTKNLCAARWRLFFSCLGLSFKLRVQLARPPPR